MTGRPDTPAFAALRSSALIAVVIGAVASIGLWRRAPQHPPPLLVVLFLIWILAPFGLLAVANILSTRWPSNVRVTLYVITLVVTAGCLAIYLDDSFSHRTAHPAGVWVAVPPASVIVSGIAIAVALWQARKKATNA
jgi:hypothetical protein